MMPGSGLCNGLSGRRTVREMVMNSSGDTSPVLAWMKSLSFWCSVGLARISPRTAEAGRTFVGIRPSSSDKRRSASRPCPARARDHGREFVPAPFGQAPRPDGRIGPAFRVLSNAKRSSGPDDVGASTAATRPRGREGCQAESPFPGPGHGLFQEAVLQADGRGVRQGSRRKQAFQPAWEAARAERARSTLGNSSN
jgi:hypothetical protein